MRATAVVNILHLLQLKTVDVEIIVWEGNEVVEDFLHEDIVVNITTVDLIKQVANIRLAQFGIYLI